jgi:hypothetical protein
MWMVERTSIDLSRRALIAATLAAPGIARAQGTFPDRPVRFVVPYSAGGGTDVTAREVAQRLTPLLGQPVIIENRTGANTAVGAEFVARSNRKLPYAIEWLRLASRSRSAPSAASACGRSWWRCRRCRPISAWRAATLAALHADHDRASAPAAS